jgi:hypothetical protein
LLFVHDVGVVVVLVFAVVVFVGMGHQLLRLLIVVFSFRRGGREPPGRTAEVL